MPTLPLLASLRAADAGPRRDDMVAGVITAILLVPQAMAYAQLAGLPPQAGLVASIVPTVIYALFGSSRTLAVGPVAVAALMVAHALQGYAGDDLSKWSAGAMILAAEGGALLLIMRSLRLGALVHFVSHPVLYGFTTGAAILIIISQIKYLVGVDLPAGAPWETLAPLLSQGGSISLVTVVFSVLTIVFLVLTRSPLVRLLTHLGMREPAAAMISRAAPLAVVLLSIVAVIGLPPEQTAGLAVVGEIASGIPLPDYRALLGADWVELAPSAMLIALVGYVESIAVARVLAVRRRQKVDADQELTALGLANLGAAVTGAMPVAGGFSRSVVNFDAGARTQVAALVTAGLVAIVTLFFTGVFEPLPQAVLAAIIIIAVAQLIDWRSTREVFRYDRGDGASLIVTMIGVLVLGIEAGLLLGVLLAIALHLRRTSVPHVAVVGRVPGTEHFRNVNRHDVESTPGVLIVRVDESLYFANVAAVERIVEHALDSALSQGPVHTLLLVMSAVSSIDASAEEALVVWDEMLAARGITLHLSEVKGPVMDQLTASDFGHSIAGRVHLTTHQALQAIESR
ncbi:MAG: sulfate permease [Oceanococcaceae bacterium]